MVAGAPRGKKQSIGLILFGLVFFVVGAGLLVAGPMDTLYRHWASSDWARVPATLNSLQVKRHQGDDSTTWSLVGSYSYRFAGRSWHSTRVSYDWGSDNIDDFHQRVASRFSSAVGRPGAVTVWVNPDDPQASYLVRELRPLKLVFSLAFGGVFAVVGLGIMLASRFRKPSLSDAQAAPIHSSEKHGHWVLVIMAVVFIGISAPPTLAIPDEIGKGNWAILLVLVFPLAGLGMAWAAWRSYRRWQYYGPMPVTLAPYPGQIGGDVAGSLPLAHYDPGATYSVTLQCVKSVVTGSGKNRSRRESIVWQDRQYPFIDGSALPPQLRFHFTPPTDQPVTAEQGNTSWYWRLVLDGPETPVPLSRTWTLPVVAGSATAEPLPQTHVARMARREKSEALAAVVEQIDVEPWQDGYQIISRVGRHRGFTVMLLVMGLVFTGAAGFLAWAGLEEGFMLFVMAFFFALFGVPMLVGGLFAVGRSLEARISAGQVYTRRSWCGINLWTRQVPLDSAGQLQLKSAGSMSQGTQKTEFFHLRVMHRGRGVRVAESIAGRDTAEALREQLVSLLRLE